MPASVLEYSQNPAKNRMWGLTDMSELKRIVTTKSLELGDSFNQIRDMIMNDTRFKTLKELVKFYPEESRIEYLTEEIHPNGSVHPSRIPILFLFSNPHPSSVLCGLFLSEPHSRTFWQRLFKSSYFHIPHDKQIDLTRWDTVAAERLGELMADGDYESDFLLYFHCFYSVPTRQMADFEALFKPNTELRNSIEQTSRKELVSLIRKDNIKHIVAFTIPLFCKVTSTNKAGWRGLVKHGKNDSPDFPKDKDVEQRHVSLSMAEADVRDVNVYMGLDTRWKNVSNDRGEHYFTLILIAILKKILATTSD